MKFINITQEIIIVDLNKRAIYKKCVHQWGPLSTRYVANEWIINRFNYQCNKYVINIFYKINFIRNKL